MDKKELLKWQEEQAGMEEEGLKQTGQAEVEFWQGVKLQTHWQAQMHQAKVNNMTTFNEAEPGEIFASGSAPDSPEGLHMTGSGKTLYWVAVKGGIGDWAMYCGWEDSPQYLKRHGAKVLDPQNIRNVMIAPDAMLAKYRK